MADVTRRPSQASYNSLERDTTRRLSKLADKLSTGKIDSEEWADSFVAVLENSHARAAMLGRYQAGDFEDLTDEDGLLGKAVAAEESRYLHKFLSDIDGGRYTGEDGAIDADWIAARSENYARKLLATANEAFVQASDPDAEFDWHLGYTEDSCSDCPDLAEGGPYTAATIPTYPRAGVTECLFNCQCSLVRSDGINGFLRHS